MNNRFCSNCGTELAPASNYCSSCGKPIKNTKQAHRNAAKQAINKLSPEQDVNDVARRRLELLKRRRKSDIISAEDENGEPIVTFRNLHPNAVWLFFFNYLGRTAILLLIFGLGALAEPWIALGAALLYFFALYLLAVINYKNYEFEVSAVAFNKVYGIFHKYSVNISYEQIENINKRRSIIDQILGLAHLEIETAGTGGEVTKEVAGLKTISEGYIPGITPEEADDVMELILARIQMS